MTPSRTIVAVVIAVSAAASFAWGGVVTPLSSNRVVSVTNRETSPQSSQSFTGPAVGPWQQQAVVSNDSSQPNWNPFGSIFAVTSSQHSNFDAGGIAFAGFVLLDFSVPVQPVPGGSVSNRCDAMFHVEGQCNYSLQATYSGTDLRNETSGTVFLRNDSTSQTLFSLSASNALAGTLLTGDYTLSIVIQGNVNGVMAANARNQIDLTFAIPAPSAIAILTPLAFVGRRRSIGF